MCLITCTDRKESHQPALPCTPTRIFTVRPKKPWTVGYWKNSQRRLRPYCGNAQSGPWLRWVHVLEGKCFTLKLICLKRHLKSILLPLIFPKLFALYQEQGFEIKRLPSNRKGNYCVNSTRRTKVVQTLVNVSYCLNPCPAEPGYTLPLQTV